MKPVHYIPGICVVVLVAWLCGMGAAFAAAPESAKLTICPGVNYQGDKCECTPEKKCKLCPCGPCTGGDKCACIKAVREATGVITGQISIYKTKVKTRGPKSSKDVMVYLEKVGDNKFPPPAKNPKMDQKGLIFIPHVIAIEKDSTVEFFNSDNDKHNVYFVDDKSGDTKDIGTWQPGESRNYTFDEHHKIVKKPRKKGDLGPDTLIVLCKLHLEMAAYIVIFDNPFHVTASIDGDTQKAKYTLKNVPPGKYRLNIWHKKLKLRGGAIEIVVEADKSTKADLEITKAVYAKKK